MSTDLKRIVEALLFVSEAPLSAARLAKVLETDDLAALRVVLDQLTAEYQGLDRAFSLCEVAGGYQFRTRPELAGWLRRLSQRQQAARLSTAALETLAIVAYRQPVLRAEIERLRGVAVDGVMRLLLERNLVRVVGRQDLPGRPLVYGTTPKFLETFGLKDLKDLPTLEEMESILGQPDRVVENRQGELALAEPGGADPGGEEEEQPPAPGPEPEEEPS